MTLNILILLLLFQVKHLIADYYMQYPYMYENKGKPIGWFIPLSEHAGIHALGTFIIIFIYQMANGQTTDFHLYILIMVGMFDFITHFLTDRWKATQKATPAESKFWQYLGIDQMIHHTVGILIIFYITTI